MPSSATITTEDILQQSDVTGVSTVRSRLRERGMRLLGRTIPNCKGTFLDGAKFFAESHNVTTSCTFSQQMNGDDVVLLTGTGPPSCDRPMYPFHSYNDHWSMGLGAGAQLATCGLPPDSLLQSYPMAPPASNIGGQGIPWACGQLAGSASQAYAHRENWTPHINTTVSAPVLVPTLAGLTEEDAIALAAQLRAAAPTCYED